MNPALLLVTAAHIMTLLLCLYLARRAWRRMSANPARSVLPELIRILLILTGFILIRPIGWSRTTSGEFVMDLYPGLISVNRGEIMTTWLAPSAPYDEPGQYIEYIVLGLPGDEFRVEDNHLIVNDQPLQPVGDPLDIVGTPCTSTEPIPPGYIVAVSKDKAIDCEDLDLIPSLDFATHPWITFWPLSRFGQKPIASRTRALASAQEGR